MFTHVCTSLPTFTLVTYAQLYLLVINYVYSSTITYFYPGLHISTYAYSCLPMITRVYLRLSLFTRVYLYLSMFSHIYLC